MNRPPTMDRALTTKAEYGSPIVFSKEEADLFYMSLNVPCQHACPAWTNIPAYIRTAYERNFGKSYEINRLVNIFPGFLGRICSRPCEDKCRHGERELGQPVNICHIKRAAADLKEMGHPSDEQLYAPNGKSVCIIGAGPTGIAAAHDLATLGFKITILEAFDEPGGMLRYGIPDFRLPRNVLTSEIEAVLRLGIQLRTGIKVGVDVTIDELLKDFDAVLVAAGCYTSQKLNQPGEHLPGVYSGLEFVMDIANGAQPAMGKTVLVIGAGFTAFDCARYALRLGAEDVSICIRGLESDLRVTADEIHEAKLEGIKIKSLMLTQRIIGQDKVQGVEFVRSKPSDKPANGKRSVTAIPDSNFVLAADSVIIAIGQGADPIDAPGEKDSRGVLKADNQTHRTSVSRLYTAGDYMTGPSTVIESIAAGRKAAEQIARDVLGKKFREWVVAIEDAVITDRQRAWDYIPRVEMPKVMPVESRLDPPDTEVELGFSTTEADEESKRCYLCYLHYEIDMNRCIYCRWCIDEAPRDCIKLVEKIEVRDDGAILGYRETSNWSKVAAVMIDNSRCIRCGACVRVCPMDCISVSKVQLVQRMVPPGEQNV